MTPSARYAAAIEVLDNWLAGEPLEKALTSWARRARYAGSKDRAAVRDIVFQSARCRNSYSAWGGGLTGRALVLGHAVDQGDDPRELFDGGRFAPTALGDREVAMLGRERPSEIDPTVDMPEWIRPRLWESLGEDFPEIAALMRKRAPMFLRVNLRRVGREEARALLANDGIETRAHHLAETALEVVSNPRRVAQAEAYRSGLVDLQDAASQAICRLVDIDRTTSVLDYCAGGGGKSTALADREPARVVAHDADPGRMQDLPERAARAGVQIDQLATSELTRRGPFDLVLCDVPCSGSGSWRRAVDGKWGLTQSRLDSLLMTQAEILRQACDLVGEGGQLAYVTCSMLRQENADQVQAFLYGNPDWQVQRERQFTPLDGGDGFYLAVLSRQD